MIRLCNDPVVLMGWPIEETIPLTGVLARATIVIGLEMQGDVEHESVRDLLGKEIR